MGKAARRLSIVLGWLVLLTAGHLLYHRILAPRHRRWGATDEEHGQRLPGDNEVEEPIFRTTRAVTVHAPPGAVWPWLVQMGNRRGGLYSYDCLDRLFGILDAPSADRILPEFQDLSPGDEIPLGRGPDWPVVDLAANRFLVLAPEPGRVSWAFVLHPLGTDETRLVSRVRVRLGRPPLMRLLASLVEVPWFVMERKMLLGIQERAEASPTP